MVAKGSHTAAATPQPYRPQDILDLFYRVFCHAMTSEESLSRSLRFMASLGGLLMLNLAMLITGLALLIAGIDVAVQVAALSPWTAGGIGIGGIITFTSAWVLSRVGHRRLSRRGTRTETEASDEAEPK